MSGKCEPVDIAYMTQTGTEHHTVLAVCEYDYPDGPCTATYRGHTMRATWDGDGRKNWRVSADDAPKEVRQHVAKLARRQEVRESEAAQQVLADWDARVEGKARR